jgi:hypothetical protein
MPECTFRELRDLLTGLGFEMRVAGEAVVFEHKPASARLVMELFAEEDLVDPATLVVVRRNLDERGILSRARFDELLRQRSLAG